MKGDQTIRDFLAEIQRANSIEEINKLTTKALKKIGFNKYVYVGFNPPNTSNRTFVQTTYPSDWIEHYTKSDFIYIDPIIQRAKRTTLPFSWAEPETKGEVNKSIKNFFNQSHDFGIKRGAVIPIHGPAGEFAALALASDTSGKEFEKIWAENQANIHLIGLYHHGVIWEKIFERNFKPTPALTAREMQCLQWAARGKTNWEISIIYTISENTVKSHLKKAFRKLGTPSRVAAISKAVVLGIITLPADI